MKNFKEFINEFEISEASSDSGLNVTPRDRHHANKLKKVLKNSDLYYEWDAREGHFFFPEEESGYDELEIEIQDLMDEHDILGYIEGIF